MLGEEIGRVKKPAGEFERYKTFNNNSDIPSKYSNDPRFNDLATDPAHKGTKAISPASRQEAMAGLEAEAQGLIKGPIQRGPAEIEFFDANGLPFDVKTPPSKSSRVPVDMDHPRVGKSIKKELSEKPLFPNNITGVLEKRRVILDCSYMNEIDHTALWKWLNTNLSSEELSRIIEINVKF
ncbi:hypothetical protein [uncultured Chryseobacterium sp.]|uniref:hypothetical protein n=1 Tax=uncultured Chryseobacterium sp. TaxID=259322 RepID=UPI0025FA3C76|nr:hypothetical protein [uncultured Chryseobacterium sp.]